MCHLVFKSTQCNANYCFAQSHITEEKKYKLEIFLILDQVLLKQTSCWKQHIPSLHCTKEKINLRNQCLAVISLTSQNLLSTRYRMLCAECWFYCPCRHQQLAALPWWLALESTAWCLTVCSRLAYRQPRIDKVTATDTWTAKVKDKCRVGWKMYN